VVGGRDRRSGKIETSRWTPPRTVPKGRNKPARGQRPAEPRNLACLSGGTGKRVEGVGGEGTVTRHEVGSRNPDTRFERTCSSVRVYGPKVTVVQKRKRAAASEPIRASDSNGEKNNYLRDDSCSVQLSQTMVIEKLQDLTERPRNIAGSRFSITIAECDFSNQGLTDGFREGRTRENRGSEPSSLFFSPLRATRSIFSTCNALCQGGLPTLPDVPPLVCYPSGRRRQRRGPKPGGQRNLDLLIGRERASRPQATAGGARPVAKADDRPGRAGGLMGRAGALASQAEEVSPAGEWIGTRLSPSRDGLEKVVK
jgi:hypothetical protein